jgi:hypothetical protein
MKASTRQSVGSFVRWASRIWSIPFLAMALAYSIPGLCAGLLRMKFDWEFVAYIIAFIIGLGLILAWRWEGIGGGITLAALMAMQMVGYGNLSVWVRFKPSDYLGLTPPILFLLSYVFNGVKTRYPPDQSLEGPCLAPVAQPERFAWPVKNVCAISVLIFVGLIGGCLLIEKAHYAQAGSTSAEICFLGFTNSPNPYLRLAMFAVSNTSPWAVDLVSYPSRQVRTRSGATNNLPHSFVGGDRNLRPHEGAVVLVYLSTVSDLQSWRLRVHIKRHESLLVEQLRKYRRFLLYLGLPVKERFFDWCDPYSEWSSE